MILTQVNQEPWFIVTYPAGLITDVLGVSSSFGGRGGEHLATREYTPAFGVGIAVMVAYAIIVFVIGMVLANRKSEE
jgi:hypothetical protein